MYLSLLELHNYYIKEKERLNLQQTNKDGPVFSHEWKDGQLDKYDERWKECDDNGEFARNIENLQENKLTGKANQQCVASASFLFFHL